AAPARVEPEHAPPDAPNIGITADILQGFPEKHLGLMGCPQLLLGQILRRDATAPEHLVYINALIQHRLMNQADHYTRIRLVLYHGILFLPNLAHINEED